MSAKKTAKPEKIDVVVKRSRWLRGGIQSYLRDRHQKQCCLGFACRVDGVPAKAMEYVGTPEDFVHSLTPKKIVDKLARYVSVKDGYPIDNAVVQGLVDVNDDTAIDDSTRERKIVRLGNKIGINFSFVD